MMNSNWIRAASRVEQFAIRLLSPRLCKDLVNRPKAFEST
jgi:hypothetical protein